MKKSVVLVMGLSVLLAFTSCKSSESAYKKAYDKAKQEELSQPTVQTPVEVTPVRNTPVVTAPVQTPKAITETVAQAPMRQEKVTMISGNGSLREYSVVCGSFTVKANADSLKEYLDNQGYGSILAFNPENGMYRVIVNTFDDRASAERARDQFKANYPNRKDFQESWILKQIY